jgi:hypothetical protein
MTALPQGDFGKAMPYLQNHHELRRPYLTKGRLPIDNRHEVEQLMKQVAVGRKR